MTDTQWLTSSHIDHGLDFLHSFFNCPFHTVNYWPTWRLQDFERLDFMVNIYPNQDHIFILNVNNYHWILFTNLDPCENSGQIEQFDNEDEYQAIERKLYDSLNNPSNSSAIKPIMNYLYPERSTFTINMVQVVQQVGSNDCGLLALAYAFDLSLKIDPSNLQYKQELLRSNYNSFLSTSSLINFRSETLNLGE